MIAAWALVLVLAQDPEALVSRLGADSLAERAAAQRDLAAMGEKAIPWLKRAAKSLDGEAQERAKQLLAAFPAETLAKYPEPSEPKQPPRPKPALQEKVQARVRELIVRLGDDSLETREAAAAALEDLGSAALPLLRAAAKESGETASRATQVLETMDLEAVIVRLKAAVARGLESHRKGEKITLASTLDRLAAKDAGEFFGGLHGALTIWRGDERLRAESTALLRAAVWEGERRIRDGEPLAPRALEAFEEALLASWLASKAAPVPAPVLVSFALGTNAEIRRWALRRLAELHPRHESMKELAALLKGGEADDRRCAFQAMARSGAPMAAADVVRVWNEDFKGRKPPETCGTKELLAVAREAGGAEAAAAAALITEAPAAAELCKLRLYEAALRLDWKVTRAALDGALKRLESEAMAFLAPRAGLVMPYEGPLIGCGLVTPEERRAAEEAQRKVVQEFRAKLKAWWEANGAKDPAQWPPVAKKP